MGYFSDVLFTDSSYEEMLRAQGACRALAQLQNRIISATEEKIEDVD
jgi:hypothetical protein